MKWVNAFSYLPVNYSIPLAEAEDQTQRVIFDNNLNGDRIRLHFSNRYSAKPLTLTRVSVGIFREGFVRDTVMVFRDESPVIRLLPGEECWSDELEYPVRAGEKVAISTYVEQRQEIGSICIFWATDGAQVSLGSADHTSGGNFTGRSMEEAYRIIREDANKGTAFYGFTGLQVLTDDHVAALAAFGDSLTHMSYMTNALCKRLYSAYPGQATLSNCGLGGNRLLRGATATDIVPGGGSCFGIAGIKRFEADVFERARADAVLLLEGINDIMHPFQFGHPDERVTPEQLIEGYRKCIEIAHKRHARIFGATIPPCGYDEYPPEWLLAFEKVRLETNRRIREGIGYDAFFDFDAALRDASRPGYVRQECHIGDGLHPNSIGGAAMAEQISFEEIMRKQ